MNSWQAAKFWQRRYVAASDTLWSIRFPTLVSDLGHFQLSTLQQQQAAAVFGCVRVRVCVFRCVQFFFFFLRSWSLSNECMHVKNLTSLPHASRFAAKCWPAHVFHKDNFTYNTVTEVIFVLANTKRYHLAALLRSLVRSVVVSWLHGWALD